MLSINYCDYNSFTRALLYSQLQEKKQQLYSLIPTLWNKVPYATAFGCNFTHCPADGMNLQDKRRGSTERWCLYPNVDSTWACTCQLPDTSISIHASEILILTFMSKEEEEAAACSHLTPSISCQYTIDVVWASMQHVMVLLYYGNILYVVFIVISTDKKNKLSFYRFFSAASSTIYINE